MPHSLFVVDDHPVVRLAMKQMAEVESDLSYAGESRDAEDGLVMIPEIGPNVVVTDLSLPGMNGIELIRELQAVCPHLPIIVLSHREESVYAERALKAGARGYVSKSAGREELLKAIRRVLQGGYGLSETVSGRILSQIAVTPGANTLSSVDRLSDREMEVFVLISKGYSTRDIADHLEISIKTVESYQHKLRQKLGLVSASDLISYAVFWVADCKGCRRSDGAACPARPRLAAVEKARTNPHISFRARRFSGTAPVTGPIAE